jgi:hypothetical protein
VSWIKLTLVGSTVVKAARDYQRGSCVQVDTGGVPRRHGYFGARHDRSGHAERKDSGDDDCSPDAHGFLHGDRPGQQVAESPGRSFTSPAVLSPSGYFMHACNRNFFFFRKCKLCDNCHCRCTGKTHFSVYRKISVSMHCKVLCNLHGAIPEQQNTQLLPEDA